MSIVGFSSLTIVLPYFEACLPSYFALVLCWLLKPSCELISHVFGASSRAGTNKCTAQKQPQQSSSPTPKEFMLNIVLAIGPILKKRPGDIGLGTSRKYRRKALNGLSRVLEKEDIVRFRPEDIVE